jgi:hypothetical protein
MSVVSRRGWLLGAAGLLLTPATRAAGAAPAMMLAEKYHPGLDLSALGQ